jgi:FecR protein
MQMPIDIMGELHEYSRVKLAIDEKRLKNMNSTQRLANRLVASSALFVAALLTLNLQAQTDNGRAEVRAVRGNATYTLAGGPPNPLKVGLLLPSGSVVKTSPEASVDLFLGNSAGVVRVTENTTLGLDKLNLTDTGAETVVEIQLNVPEGTILGNVNKLSAASKYEIKLPNGVAGIRGTRFRCSATSYIVLLDGTLIFVFVPPGGNPTPYTLVAPPAVYFSPIEGIKPAPPDLVREVLAQFGKELGLPGPPKNDRRLPKGLDRGDFLSPGTGAKP